MISKVKRVQGNGDWDSKYGKMYKFEYEFEDGTILVANHKEPNGNFQVGDEVEYEVTRENEYGKQGKVSKPEQQSGKKSDPETNKRIHLQVCMKIGAEVLQGQITPTPEDVAKYAVELYKLTYDAI